MFSLFVVSLIISLSDSKTSVAGIYQLESTHKLRWKRETNITQDTSVDTNNNSITNVKYINSEEVDDHNYYRSKYIPNGEQYFIDLLNPPKDIASVKHQKASDARQKAYNITLDFPFTFYGHVVQYLIVTTGGFIHIGPQYHAFIHLVHYIAPLMADFNPSASNSSEIYIGKGKGMFIVQWNNLLVSQDKDTHPKLTTNNSTFTFQTVLYQNGTIRFAYKQIPVSLLLISNSTHNVTVGFSDGFVMSYKRITGEQVIWHNYINTYHKVKFPLSKIQSGVVYELIPLVTCNQLKSCSTCMNTLSAVKFTCGWCPQLKRCSDEFDWGRQEWLQMKCNHDSVTTLGKCSNSQNASELDSSTSNGAVVGGIVGVLIFVLLVAGVCLFYYAYTRPQTKSGLWLIEHHPRRIMKRRFDPLADDELL